MFKCEYCDGLFEFDSHTQNCSARMLLEINKKYMEMDEMVHEQYEWVVNTLVEIDQKQNILIKSLQTCLATINSL